MLRKHDTATNSGKTPAIIFAALGDATRLLLITKLCDGQLYSITQLTAGSDLTRQAITKHLRVLESVGIVQSVRTGRTNLFEFNPKPMQDIKEYLTLISQHWDQALSRLKVFVEKIPE